MPLKGTKESFVVRAKECHQGQNLDYSKFNYVNSTTKGIIIDHDINPLTGKEFGVYLQSPKAHLMGHGHPEKARQARINANTLNVEDFIRRDKIVHAGENIEYGEYKGMNNKMKFIDHDINPSTGEEYGEYYCTPNNHLKGDGYPNKRKGNRRKNSPANTRKSVDERKAEFLSKAHEAHPGEKLDYSKVKYVNNSTPVCIIDHDINPDTGKEYGEYWQTPAKHILGRGHRLKGINKQKKSMVISQEEFVERAHEAHPEEKLDYSKAHYVNMFTPITIIDHDINPLTGKEYGEYEQIPINHLKGCGHPDKGRNSAIKKRLMDREGFIKRAKEAHPNSKYDYKKVKYSGYDTPVCIIDHGINPDTGEEYGEFWQTPSKHLSGHDNPARKNQKISETNAYTQEQAIEVMKRVHPEPYFDFSQVKYDRRGSEITVICHKKDKNGVEHGPFKTTFAAFISSKCGCPKCNETGTSLKQKIIYNYVCELVGKDKVQENVSGILFGRQSLDIYVESMNIAIEFDGLFWHSTGSPNYQGDSAILNKTEECLHKGIRLIHIFEDEWDEHPDLVKDKLSYIFGCSKGKQKIGARKCEIREIYKSDSDTFLEKNHIQGKASASVYLGAFYKGKLVSVMLFKKTGKESEYELNRFASDIRFIIQGIASKLLKYFMNLGLAKSIISFADRRWTDENKNVYISLGFTKIGYTRPTYWYCGKREPLHRYHKFGFRKQILARKFKFSTDMTESEMVKELGLNKIYDCGLIKYELKC